MKKSCLCVILIYVIFLFSACTVDTSHETESTGIVGIWSTEVTVIGLSQEDTNEDGDNTITYHFRENLTGTLAVHANNKNLSEDDFTYQITEEEIQILFPSGDIWEFPYVLDGDSLILTQNRAHIEYTRVKKR